MGDGDKKGHRKASNILFLDLDVAYMGMFNL